MGLYINDIFLLLIFTFLLVGSGIYAIELSFRFINWIWRMGRYAIAMVRGKLDTIF